MSCRCFFILAAARMNEAADSGCEGGQTNRSRCLSVLEETWEHYGDPESNCLAKNLCEKQYRRLHRMRSETADAWLNRRKIVEGTDNHLTPQQRHSLIEGIHKAFLMAWWQDGGLGVLRDPLLLCKEPLALPNEIPCLRDFLPQPLRCFVIWLLEDNVVHLPSNQSLQNLIDGDPNYAHEVLVFLTGWFGIQVPPQNLLDGLFCALCDNLTYYQTLWISKFRGITFFDAV